MKTSQAQSLQCLACGGTLNRIDDNDHYECLQCGETYDLKVINSMELDLESFDKLLLYTIKNYKAKSYKKLRR